VKNAILSFIVVIIITAGPVLAQEDMGIIHPDFTAFVASTAGGDITLLSVFPNSDEARKLLNALCAGGLPDIIVQDWHFLDTKPISSVAWAMQKPMPIALMATAIKNYTVGEFLTHGIGQDSAASLATELAASTIFAEVLSNIFEVLRLTYTFRNFDGSLGYGTSVWMAVEKSSLLDQEIAKKATAGASGNYRPADPANQGTTGTRRPDQYAGTSSDDLLTTVKERLESVERLRQLREANRIIMELE
jgi:hypothetical protein